MAERLAMRAALASVLALAALQASADPRVDGEIPAGNVIVERVSGDRVFLRQDMRDSRNWFYWAFRVTGAEGRTVNFTFTDPYADGPVSCRGPAVTRDGGLTWSYAAEGRCTTSNFVYTFAADERETWFYQTFQYYPPQWEDFLARHAEDRGRVFESGVLCKSRKGRDVPKARFGRISGEPRYRVWLSSRIHCGEAPATYVVEGWLERVFAKDALGAWLRENVEFMVVPFVDYDGVTDGDQGKGRKPHDHNRDYVAFLYPESKAIAAWLTGHAKGKLDLAIDCHCPWVRNRHNEKVYQTYHADEWNTAAKIRWGRLLEKAQDGSMNYSVSGDFPWRFGWNGAGNTAPAKPGGQPLKGLGGWIGDNFTNLIMNSTYEIPFANASGRTVTPESCRAFGSASAEVLKAFLEEMRPAVREGVVCREDCDRFGDRVACFNAGAGTAEGRNGRCLAFEPGSSGDFRSGWFKIGSAPRAKDWKLGFDFAFGTDGTRAFEFKFAFGDRANPDVRTLHVDERGSHFGYAPTEVPADGLKGFLPGGRHEWNAGTVVVSDGKAVFWTRRGGVLVKECETRFPSLPLVGWNFGIADERGGRVFLDNVVVTDACSRPFDRGDPAEWLGETPVATRFQWDEYWGNEVTPSKPLAVDFAKQNAELRVRFPGRVGGAMLLFNAETGRVARIWLSPERSDLEIPCREAGGGVFTNAIRRVSVPADFFRVGGTGTRDGAFVRTRPSLRDRGVGTLRERQQFFAAYDILRTLGDLVWAFEVRRVARRTYRVLLNENVLAEFECPVPIVSIGVEGKGAEVHGWADADALVGKDPQTLALPIPAGGFALSRCGAVPARDAFDALPSACLFNVPKRQWVRATAVCRVDPAAPTNAIPVVTARLTEIDASGGRSSVRRTVDLRDPGAAVVWKGLDCHVTFDFDIGSLQDLVFGTDGHAPYLHFEFTGPVWERDGEVSSLQVFAGTLEASPADFRAVANKRPSLYRPDETVGAEVTVAPRVAGTYRIESVVRDEDGRTVERSDTTLVDSAAPETVQVNFAAKDPGWYEVAYTLRDAAFRPLVTHEASFVRLPAAGEADCPADSICSARAFAYPRREEAAALCRGRLFCDASFVRRVPTDSPSVVAFEFETPEGRVYEIRTERGETAVTVDWALNWGILPTSGSGDVVARTGRLLRPRADGKIAVGEESVYLVTKDRVSRFAVDPKRTFLRERFAGMAMARTVQPLVTADEIDLAQDGSAFGIATVTDEEKGDCVELRHRGSRTGEVAEGAALRFREPKPVEGACSRLGVWVKGDRGRIRLEFLDAEGERWCSAESKGMCVNYDGWNFLQLPLRRGTPLSDATACPWKRDGRGNGRIDFPITVTSVQVGLTGEASSSLRFGPVQVW